MKLVSVNTAHPFLLLNSTNFFKMLPMKISSKMCHFNFMNVRCYSSLPSLPHTYTKMNYLKMLK